MWSGPREALPSVRSSTTLRSLVVKAPACFSLIPLGACATLSREQGAPLNMCCTSERWISGDGGTRRQPGWQKGARLCQARCWKDIAAAGIPFLPARGLPCPWGGPWKGTGPQHSPGPGEHRMNAPRMAFSSVPVPTAPRLQIRLSLLPPGHDGPCRDCFLFYKRLPSACHVPASLRLYLLPWIPPVLS